MKPIMMLAARIHGLQVGKETEDSTILLHHVNSLPRGLDTKRCYHASRLMELLQPDQIHMPGWYPCIFDPTSDEVLIAGYLAQLDEWDTPQTLQSQR